jgi:hypothetical protein
MTGDERDWETGTVRIFEPDPPTTLSPYRHVASQEQFQGLIPRALRHIFRDIEKDHSVVVSYVQLYKEQIQDLFSENMETVQLREDARFGVYLRGVRENVVESPEDCMDLLAHANCRRATSSTAMNDTSSRSHAVHPLAPHTPDRSLSDQLALSHTIRRCCL